VVRARNDREQRASALLNELQCSYIRYIVFNDSNYLAARGA
jgi:hypothetical protein